MVFWGPHRNSLWQKKFCCNLFQVKPYFAWTIGRFTGTDMVVGTEGHIYKAAHRGLSSGIRYDGDDHDDIARMSNKATISFYDVVRLPQSSGTFPIVCMYLARVFCNSLSSKGKWS